MYKYIVAAVALIGLAHPAHADEISNRDQLMAYLKEQMPDGQEISSTFNVDGKLAAGQNHGGCMAARTLAQLDLIARVMIQESLMRVMVTREDTGYQVIGNTKPACEYEIVQFDLYKLSKLGIETPPGDGPAKSVTIPLFEQKVLGVTDVDTKGYVSMGMQGTTCDVSFTPWFGNSKPSRFALYYKGKFLNDSRYKNVFSSEYEALAWCMQLHYDGTYKWKFWSRL